MFALEHRSDDLEEPCSPDVERQLRPNRIVVLVSSHPSRSSGPFALPVEGRKSNPGAGRDGDQATHSRKELCLEFEVPEAIGGVVGLVRPIFKLSTRVRC